MLINQLKVHPFQGSGFRWVNLHPYTADGFRKQRYSLVNFQPVTEGKRLEASNEITGAIYPINDTYLWPYDHMEL